MRFILGALLALTASAVSAAPQPKPPIPTEIAFTQRLVTRSLPILGRANCTDFRAALVNGQHGQTQFRLICGNTVQGSFVSFQTDGGPIYAQWVWPAPPPPPCNPPTLPAPVVTTNDCAVTNPGTTGTWQQTATYSAASPQVPPDGCWILGTPLPTTAPAGACTTVTPPGLVPAVNVSGDPMLPKPARGVTLTTRYGTMINRISDHAADRPSVPMIRNDYSRRDPVNLDGTRLLVDCDNGFWCVYDITDPIHAHFIEVLNGPAGDAELQWSATDPDILLYLGRNGDTTLRQVKVSTNVSTVLWDFTSAVRAFWPGAVHCWTKSEGSPSEDGKLWGLMCEDAGFAPLGFVVLDINTPTVIWHKDNSVRPDHVSMSPTGRWFEVSGDDPRGTIFYGIAPDVLGQTRQGHHKSEHSDIGRCNAHDFYASVDYQTNLGDVFWIDLEDPSVTRHVVGYVYGHPNPWFGTNYALHISAKAFGKCGFLSSNYGVPPANIVWFDFAAPNVPGGVGENYAADQNYFDEVQAALSRDGASYFYNDNFGGPSQTGDVYRGTIPQ